MSLIPSLPTTPTALSPKQERTYLSEQEYSQGIDQIARTLDPQQRAYLEAKLFLRHWRNWEPRPVSLIEESLQRYGWAALAPSLWGFTEDSFAARKEQLLHHIALRQQLHQQRSRLLKLFEQRQQQLRLAQQHSDLEASLFS